jgi:excisionase family DNA binding protein
MKGPDRPDELGALDEQPQLLPAKAAAALLGLPYSTLRALTRRGEVRVLKVGARWYFHRADLTAFLERRDFLTPDAGAGMRLLKKGRG